MSIRFLFLTYAFIGLISANAHAFSFLVCESSDKDYKAYFTFDFDESILVWSKLRTKAGDYNYKGKMGDTRRWTGSPMIVRYGNDFLISAPDDTSAELFKEDSLVSVMSCCALDDHLCKFKWFDLAN